MPAEETEDTWAITMKQKGISRYIAITSEGLVFPEPVIEYTSKTAYTQALQAIKNLEEQGILMRGSHIAAVKSLADGEFESSQWATYLPRPE
jgi:hypothetical protein